MKKVDIICNTITKFKYNDTEFKINSRNYKCQNKLTYKCIFNRITFNKEKNENIFCNATITALRNENNLKELIFFLKEYHSKRCIEKYKELNINKKSNSILKNTKEKENIISDKLNCSQPKIKFENTNFVNTEDNNLNYKKEGENKENKKKI